jgi:hypothetical protein
VHVQLRRIGHVHLVHRAMTVGIAAKEFRGSGEIDTIEARLLTRRSDQIRSDQIRSDQIRSDEVGSDQSDGIGRDGMLGHVMSG